MYLWCEDNSIRIINWDSLVEIIKGKIDSKLKLAVECGFRRSEYLYGHKWNLFFSDDEIRNIIKNKFIKLSEKIITVSQDQLAKAQIRHQKNPFPFPHSDLIIYNYKFYVAGQKGIFSSSCDKSNKNPVSSRVNEIRDISSLSIAASYSSLAVSAGSEGLFEISLDYGDVWGLEKRRSIKTIDNHFRQLSRNHSSSCRWAYHSIFSSSHADSSFLADFDNKEVENNSDHKMRTFRGILTANELFNHSAYSWGTQEKLCQIFHKKIKVVKYNPWGKEERFTDIGELDVQQLQGNIISAESALFGYIIEVDSGLIVIDSRGETFIIEGEPVNWRVFPRSKYYENQLHVVYDDRLEIYSFNDDYFVNQEEKLSGLRYSEWQANRR